MSAQFVQVSPELLRRLQAEPEAVPSLFDPDESARIRIGVHASQRHRRGSREHSASFPREAEGGTQVLTAAPLAPLPGKGPSLSLQKAGHGIHYLLSGELKPGTDLRSQIVLGGAELGRDFSGHGPARNFTVQQTLRAAGVLTFPGLLSEMQARFDPSEMTRLRIYPDGWRDTDLDWLLQHFYRLRDFYTAAALQGLALFTCLV